MSIKRDDIRAVLENYIDTPDWEKDADNPAPAIAHQLLVSIAATTGLRSVLWNCIKEILAKHDNWKDIDDDLEFLRSEIHDDLQFALRETTLGAECDREAMEWSAGFEARRGKEKE